MKKSMDLSYGAKPTTCIIHRMCKDVSRLSAAKIREILSEALKSTKKQDNEEVTKLVYNMIEYDWVYGGKLMASPTEAKMYHHTKLNVEPKLEVLSSAPAKQDENNDDESKDSQRSDNSDGFSGDVMDLNDIGHDINPSFNTPNAERDIIIAQPSEPDIVDVLIKENQKAWGLVRQWEAKYKQLEESWELRARVIAALEAKLFDQSGPSNMDMDIKNCMEWKDIEIQRLTKLVINLECKKTILQDLFDDQSVHIITQVVTQKAHGSFKKHPTAALEHIISPPSRVKHIKQKVRKEHWLDEFEYPNLLGQKKGEKGAEKQSHALTLNNKLKVWANMSKLNKQKVQNLHTNDGDKLLVWRRDSKTKDVYFDDIIHIIKEESITNNMIDAYGKILLELQGLVNPTLEDSAFIFTSTCLIKSCKSTPHKRNKLIDVHIKEYQGKRFLIFPIHDNFHWTIVVYDVKDNVWRHYNSLRLRPSIHDPFIDKAQIVVNGTTSTLWCTTSDHHHHYGPNYQAKILRSQSYQKISVFSKYQIW
ncbi:unnamed protein product [Camellia sinensis]